MSFRIDLMKGKIRRLRGNFDVSQQYFEPLSGQYPSLRSQFLSRLHLIAVYTVLGLWEKGQALISLTEAAVITDIREKLTDKRERLL